MDNSNEKKTESFLELLEQKQILKYYRKVILILGNSKSKKSVFTQFVATNDKINEFSMKDDSYIIKKNSASSNAILTNVIEDFENNVTFYDCPAFSDTAIQHVIGTYFIKNIIDSAHVIKLIFTMDYSSIKEYGKKLDCWSLVKHPIQLVKNFNKFNLSMAFVATNVDHELKGNKSNSEFIDNYETIVYNTGNILKNCKKEIIQLHKSCTISNDQRKDAIHFIDNLINKDKNNKYTGIGIFRKYEDKGLRSFTNVTLLLSNKNTLKEMIHKHLKFSTHNATDFRYDISANSTKSILNLITDLSMKINIKIQLYIEIMAQKIKQYFLTEEQSIHNIDNLYKRFNLSHTTFLSTQTDIAKCLEIQCLTIKIIQNINNLNITTLNEDLANVENYGMFLKFIKSVSSGSDVINPIKWSNGLKHLISYLYNSKKWYYFLKLLDDTLGTYKVQKGIEKNSNSTMNLVYPKQYSKIDSLLNLLKNIFVNYAGISKQEFEEIYDDIKNVNLNAPKKQFLNKILDQAFNYSTSICYDGGKLIVKGYYPMLSSIHRANCSQAKFIEILALKKFYIDTDLIRTNDEVQLFVIAPESEVLGLPVIYLGGVSRTPMHNCSKADDCNQSNLYRQSASAGDFVGITRKIIRQNYLNIVTDGGIGIQFNATSCAFNEMEQNNLTQRSCYLGQPFLNKPCKTELEYFNENEYTVEGTCFLYDSNCTEFYKNIGRSGYNIFITSETQSNIIKNDTVSRTERREILPERVCRRQRGMTYKQCTEIKFQYKSTTGISFKYLRHFDMQKETITIFDTLPTVINDYKQFAMENIMSSLREPSMGEFLIEIDKHDLYNTLGFVNELQNLEEQFYELKKDRTLLPFYQSLLNRVKRHKLKLHNNQELKEDDKNVLNFLSAVLLNKVCILAYNKDSDFSRNLPKYLDEVISDINELKNLHKLTLKYNYNENFQDRISNKIKEAVELIMNKILPEIDNIFPQIEIKVKSMFSEINSKLTDIETDTERLYILRDDMQVKIGLSILFSVLKTASLCFFLFGPIGIAFGVISGLTLSIGENTVLNGYNPLQNGQDINIPNGVLYGLKKVNDEFKQEKMDDKEKFEIAKKQLTDYLKEDPDNSLKEIKEKISNILDNLKAEENKGTDVSDISVNIWASYKTEVSDLIKVQKDKLGKKPSPINTKRIKMLDRVQGVLIVGTEISRLGKTIRNELNNIEDIDNAIRINEVKTELLKNYEDIISRIIIPMVHQMKTNITTTTKTFSDLSKASLEVAAWKVQNALRDVEIEIKRMVQGFSVVDDISNLIEKLRNSLTIVKEMYTHIQEYEEMKILANYFADITVDKPTETVTDNELDKTLKSLKFIMQSNLILGKYQNSINAFQHEVFPLAHYYLRSVTLPVIRTPSEINSSVTKIVKIIKKLKTNLDKYMTGRNDYLQNMHKNVMFGCYSQYIPPFFVWKFDKYKRDIHKLLDGEEVLLKSNIGQGINKNAIKFNVIKIRFNLSDKLKQDRFDTELTNFVIRMKHHGTSYYRCDNKFYKITNKKRDVIEYIFNKYCNEKVNNPNGVYDSLANYHPVLSPYAMWSIQITNNVRGGNFDNLSMYKNEEMDLLLEGNGEYIDLEIPDLCYENIDKYYTEDDTISETNFVDIGKFENLYANIRANYDKSKDYGNITRITRNVNQNDENHFLMTNNGCNDAKSSFINNFFNLIGNSLTVFRYWIPTNDVSQWSINYRDTINDEKQRTVNADIQLLNPQHLQKLIPNVFNESADNESQTIENNLNTYLFCSNVNLLFLDSVIRWKNGKKYNQQYHALNNDIYFQNAQHLAYRAYTHENI